MLTPNKEHKKVFPNIPVIESWNGKSLKDFLARTTLTGVADVNHAGKKLV